MLFSSSLEDENQLRYLSTKIVYSYSVVFKKILGVRIDATSGMSKCGIDTMRWYGDTFYVL